VTLHLKRLMAHLKHPSGRLSLVWVLPDEWENLLLDLELARSEYIAFPVDAYGWLVLTTARVRGSSVCAVAGEEEENWVQDFARKHGSELVLCSPGWADAAD
jgi:hypothetical protein